MHTITAIDAVSIGSFGIAMIGVTDLMLLREILGLFSCESSLLTSLARALFALGWCFFLGEAKCFPSLHPLLENVCYKLANEVSLDWL